MQGRVDDVLGQVLLASGNQLRNLDKQLALLSRCGVKASVSTSCDAHDVRRFPFLKKLELFDNPVRRLERSAQK